MTFIKVLSGLMIAAIAVGCASGNCRSQREKNPQEAQASAVDLKKEEAKLASPAAKMKVYKYDGTLQCGQGKKIALDQMAKELNGITIHSSKNQTDGLMRIQVCGSPTGMANVFEIDRTQLPEALKRGFKEWLVD